MMERGTSDLWRYKRAPSLTLPRREAIRTAPGGIRYLTPSLVLLFKAKHRRPKDEEDFDAALPELTEQDQRELRSWLRDLHPDHGWIDRLNG